MLILCFVLGIFTIAMGLCFCTMCQTYDNYSYGKREEIEKCNPKKYARCKFFRDNEWAYRTPIISGIIISCVSLIAIIFVAADYSGIINIDDKISLYETENTNIEQQISVVVENYKGWESDTYTQFKNESPTVLISLFPELKSNELVGKQLEIYVSNNQTIKYLKELRLNYKVSAWWLYFGS